MCSTPLICSSSGVATAAASTRGFAPGYTARTTIDGGTTSGYSLIGRVNMEIRPVINTTIDNTAAKIGRSIKNLEIFIGVPGAQRAAESGAVESATIAATVGVTFIPGRTRCKPLMTI